MEKKETYKAKRRLDYKAPDFTASSIELTFELSDDATVVKTNARYKRLTSDNNAPLCLDGEDLELTSVTLDGASCKYSVEPGRLIIENVPNEFELEIENVISPASNSELMGLYKSNGTFCTQCEPQGFRRITYFLDRPDVLARYKVTIIGPEYGAGVLLSNGNLIESGTRKGKNYTVWEDPFPKPSYLFALVAGTFDIVKDTYKTKSGRTVELELYVDRGSYDRGLWAMQSIKTSMKWDEERWGLEYDLNNFKVVAVDFFNQGAMENKSLNIFNSIYVMVDPQTATDSAFYNVESVIGHEYFHNYTGDRVTLRDWFQLSLKESLTVFRDQEFSSDVASRTLTRLHAVDVIRGPQFAEDASPMSHPVRPEQVMEMNNFYTVTIYDKGAEVIRMIHTLIGEVNFKSGLRLYLSKYDGRAVTIEDFLDCMESASGYDLSQFRRWYTQDGTPRVSASWTYDESKKQLHLTLEQHTPPTHDQAKKEPFYIPVRISFLNAEGYSVHPAELDTSGVIVLKQEKEEYSFTLDKDTLPVLLRDFSAPVKLQAKYTATEYKHMLKFCDDPFIKVDSGVQLTNRYIHENISKVSQSEDNLPIPTDLIDAYGVLLDGVDKDTDLLLLNESIKIQSLANMMETFDSIDLNALVKLRIHLERCIATALYDKFKSLTDMIKPSSPKYSVPDMGRRAVRNTAMHMQSIALKAMGQNNEATKLVSHNYFKAQNMTEALAAMTDAVHGELDCAQSILDDFESKWSSDALVFDNFFRV